LICSKNYNSLNVYVDFKNACNSLFIEDVVKELVYSTDTNSTMDTCIFQATLFFSSYWKQFANYYNIPNCNIFFAYDIGESFYHMNIDSKYKQSRRISPTALPEYFEDMTKIRNHNCLLAEKMCNRIPNVYFFILKHMESDFLPYYLQTRVFNQEDTFNITCSNDKDLLQGIRGNNSIMMYKLRGQVAMIQESHVLPKYTKLGKYSNKTIGDKIHKLPKMDLDYLSVMMAVIGDSGDDVQGVNKIGPMKMIDMFSDGSHEKHLGTYKELCDRVMSGGTFFRDDVDVDNMDKNWKLVYNSRDIAKNAVKLISFECLTRYLEDSNIDNAVTNKNYIYKILDKNNFNLIDNPDVMFEGLSRLRDLYMSKEDMVHLF